MASSQVIGLTGYDFFPHFRQAAAYHIRSRKIFLGFDYEKGRISRLKRKEYLSSDAR